MIARLLALSVALLAASPAQARIVEEVVTLPVEVTDADGKAVKHDITVTIFRDDARAKAPFLIFNHGRNAAPDKRAALGRARYPGNARYFVQQGYAVFIPTRIGYGVSGGPDLENSGACQRRNFPPAYEAAAQQSLAVIAYAKAQPWVDAADGLLAGQSFGGVTSLALAAKGIPGVRGVVNFAGGGGGQPERNPEKPCSAERMAQLLATYGKTAKVPTLWLYAENDRYWGPTLPREWFDTFVKAGGSGKFVLLPASGEDGHFSFRSDPASWRPPFEEFIAALRKR